MTHRWLVLQLRAPLMAFGAVSIDGHGPVRAFPALSMVTGLLGNALGWHWRDRAAHQALQDRTVMAARLDRQGRCITDTQNARLGAADKGWTTRGVPAGRDGGSYGAPHRRQREYWADASLRVVLRLAGQDGVSLDDLAKAVQRPARPLYIGRKSCLPTAPIFGGWTEAESAHGALASLGDLPVRAEWPDGDGPQGARVIDLPDLRDWNRGVHSGRRLVVQGRVAP